MATLERLRQRISTADDLRSVVKTMKGLAAVSGRAFETAAAASEHYRATVECGLQALLRTNPDLGLVKPGAGTTAVIVFGSEQGLCGSFNRIVAQAAASESGPVKRAATGARGVDAVGRQFPGRAVESLPMPASVDGITDCVGHALRLATRWIEDEAVSRIVLVGNELVTGARFEPVVSTLFPFDPEWLDQLKSRQWESRGVAVHFSPAGDVLKSLVRNHLFIGLFRAFATSLAAEHAARLAAMQVAEKNIDQRLAELNRRFHQLRQATVTEELLDVVSAFEALQDGGDSASNSP